MEIYIILAVVGIVYIANRYRKAKQHRERMKQQIQIMREKNIPGAEQLWKSFGFDKEE
jgi:hypothetical protein